MKRKVLYMFICLSLFFMATGSIGTIQLASASPVLEDANLYLFIPKPGLKKEEFEKWVNNEVFPQIKISQRNISNVSQKLIKSNNQDGNTYYIWKLSIDFVGNPDQNAYTEMYGRMKNKLANRGILSTAFSPVTAKAEPVVGKSDFTHYVHQKTIYYSATRGGMRPDGVYSANTRFRILQESRKYSRVESSNDTIAFVATDDLSVIGKLEEIVPQEVSSHGMLVIGSERIFISHLPMYSVPHRFQGIWEVTFEEKVKNRYLDFQKMVDRAGRPLYPYFTLAPKENFALRELVGDRISYQADLYGGHFERDGHKIIMSDIDVTIKKTVYWKELDPKGVRPLDIQLIAFGSAEELFLAHKITAPPNYDQILKIVPEHHQNLDDGTILVLLGQRDIHEGKLQKGEREFAFIPGANGSSSTKANRSMFSFLVTSQYYLEENELAKNFLSP